MHILGLIAAVCAQLNAVGFTHTPRLVRHTDLDLSEFEPQPSDIPGIDTEYVYQCGPGMYGDDFNGTMAYPLGEYFFVVSYST